jgi:hypothetical protein
VEALKAEAAEAAGVTAGIKAEWAAARAEEGAAVAGSLGRRHQAEVQALACYCPRRPGAVKRH